MSRIVSFLRQWDKVAHIAVSMAIMLFCTGICSLIMNNWIAIGIGSIVCLLCGALKEAYDADHGGTCSWNDFYADLIGFGLAVIPLILISI